MQFRLVFEGQIRPHQQASIGEIHSIRERLHPQMRALWDFPPLSGDSRKWLQEPDLDQPGEYFLLEKRGNRIFAPLVSKRNDLQCELEITFLRQQAPGQLIGDGGDIDNRIKTLLDALSVPPPSQAAHFRDAPSDDPLFCLLQDDDLVTKVSVETDRLLRPSDSRFDLVAIIKVTIKAVRVTWGTISLMG